MRIFDTGETEAYYKDMQEFADEIGITLEEAVMLDTARSLRSLVDEVNYLSNVIADATDCQ